MRTEVERLTKDTRPRNIRLLEAGYKAQQTRTQVTADSTGRAIACLAHWDIRKFYDAHGNLLPIHSLPDDLAACIQSIDVVRRNLAAGDGTTDKVWKIKLWNKPQALELRGACLYAADSRRGTHAVLSSRRPSGSSMPRRHT